MKSVKNRNLIMVCAPFSLFVVVMDHGFVGLAIMWAIIGFIVYLNTVEQKNGAKKLDPESLPVTLSNFNKDVVMTEEYKKWEETKLTMLRLDQQVNEMRKNGQLSFDEYWDYSQRSESIWRQLLREEPVKKYV